MAAMEASGTKSQGFSYSVREATAEDTEALGVICFEAFKNFNTSVGVDYTIDFPTVEITTTFLRTQIEGPEKAYFCVVAVDDETGKPIGSGFLHNSDSEVYSIGPISVDPHCSGQGAGKLMMTSMINRAKEDKATSIRLIQVAANTRSFALYTSLGFVARDCIAVFTATGATVDHAKAAAAASALGLKPKPDAVVRLMEEADVAGCAELHQQTHGYDRLPGIQRSIGPSAWVATSKSGEILAYTAAFTMFGHTVATSEDDFITLFLGIASKSETKAFLTISPVRNPKLAQWALAAKLRLMRNNWYMVIGDYQAPKGGSVYFASIKH